MRRKLCFLSASVITILSSAAHAADYTFDGGAGTTNWLTPQNWTTDTLPTNADNALINNGTNVQVTGAGAVASSVRVGTNTGLSGGITVTGAGSSLIADQFLISIIGAGTLTVQSGGSATANTIYLGQFGGANGTGTVLTGGTLSGTDIYVGSSASSTGLLRVSGGSLSTTNLRVGNNGNGTVVIENGGQATTSTMTINGISGVTAEVTVTDAGSQMDSTGDVVVGSAALGLITVKDSGVFNNTANVYFGLFGGSSGTLVIDNGGIFSGNNVYLGANTNSSGTATVGGAGSELNASGTLRVGGAGNGALTVSNGGDVSASSISLANSAGSNGTINIGAAAGDTPVAAGTLSVPTINFGAGTGTLNFNHTDTNYMFSPALVGTGTMNAMSGTTTLTGNNSSFSGTTDVSGGTLIVNGALGGTLTSSGGRIKGSGTLSQLTVDNGGTAAPGNSIGTLNAVNVIFNSGSIYEVELNAAGLSDLINASGTATLNGGTVVIVPYPDYQLNYNYTILTATGGVTGLFDATSAPLLDALLTYDANNVYVTLSQSTTALSLVGRTPNQRAAARGMAFVDASNSALTALYASPDVASAQRTLDLLSGEIHASTTGALMQAQSQIRNAIPGFEEAPKEGDNRIWVKTFGNKAQTGSTDNTASLDEHGGGALTGIEHGGKNSRYGVAFGASETRLDEDALASEADVSSFHALVYGGTGLPQSGVVLSGGVSGSFHDVDTERDLNFGAFDQTSKTSYSAQSYQVFGEAARPVEITQDSTVTPYAQAAYTLHHSGEFKESGDAGLESDGEMTRLASTVLGLRMEQKIDRDDLPAATFNAGAGWQRNYGDLDGKRSLSFNDSTGEKFSIKGAPIDRDVLLLHAGLGIELGNGANLSFSYGAGLGKERTGQAISASLFWKF